MDLPVVDEIDFLPADFHRRRFRHRVRRWRWGVGAAFLVLVALGWAGNRVQHARLAAARDRLTPRAEAVADLDRQLAALRAEIDALGLRADLRGRLRLRPATTRLLAAVTSPLPPRVALTELHLGESRPAAAPAAPPPANGSDALPPERRDLDRLVDESKDLRRLVTVRGLAPDDGAVSAYLDALRRSGPFDEVRLLFTDRHERRGHELRAFAVELRVREPQPPGADLSPVAARSDGGAL